MFEYSGGNVLGWWAHASENVSPRTMRSQRSWQTKRCAELSSPWFASAWSACPRVIPASMRSASSEVKSRTSTDFIVVFCFAPPNCTLQRDVEDLDDWTAREDDAGSGTFAAPAPDAVFLFA